MKRTRILSVVTCTATLALAAILPGCQGGKAEPKGSPQVKMGELPDAHRELWRAWLRRDPAYPALREEALLDASQTTFLIENLVATLLTELTASRVETVVDGQPTLYGRAQYELIEIGPHSAPALAEVLPLGMGMGPVAVGDLLVAIGGPAVAPLLEQLARRKKPLARRRAAKALGDLAQNGVPPGVDAQAVRQALGEHLNSDDDWIVRSQCALALGPWGKRSVHEMNHSGSFLLKALKDPDESVRADAVHGLARLGDPRTFPALFDHLERAENSGDLSMTMLTQAALGAMTRYRNARTPAEWRAWWRESRLPIMKRFLDQ